MQTETSALAELVNFSLRQQSIKLSTSGAEWDSLSLCFASPLEPLRARDTLALEVLFEQDNLEEIVSDIKKYLLWLWPEPCWEEELYDYFEEF